MAYHGYTKALLPFLTDLEHEPHILEIGIYDGAAFNVLAKHLVNTRKSFVLYGVDIEIRHSVQTFINELPRNENQKIFLIEENSLSFLPKIVEQDILFDIIFLDGDHNYYTVSHELPFIKKILRDDGFLVLDDYHGRWSNKDLWYTELPEFQHVSIASKRISTNKIGVQAAVNDWIIDHPDWVVHTMRDIDADLNSAICIKNNNPYMGYLKR